MSHSKGIEFDNSQLMRLRKLALRLEEGARLARNGNNTSEGERAAIQLDRDADALNWVLHQFDPELEMPLRLFNKLSSIAPSNR